MTLRFSDYQVFKIVDPVISRPTFEKSLSPRQNCFHFLSLPPSSSLPHLLLLNCLWSLTSFKTFRKIMLFFSKSNPLYGEDKWQVISTLVWIKNIYILSPRSVMRIEVFDPTTEKWNIGKKALEVFLLEQTPLYGLFYFFSIDCC